MLSALVFVAGLALAPRSASAQGPVFPADFCAKLRRVSPEVLDSIKSQAPEMAQGVVRDVPLPLALEMVRRGVSQGLGSIDLFTDDAFRGQCIFYMSGAVMAGIEDKYALDLVAPVYHNDKDGKRFQTTGLVAGQGKIYIFYDRGDIHYDNENAHREFRLNRVVRLETPARETLGPIQGISVHVFLIGDLPIRSIVREGADKLHVKAGSHDSFSKWTPIRPKSSPSDTSVLAMPWEFKSEASPNGNDPSIPPTADLAPLAAPALDSLQGWAAP